jgi:hypothetical protein
MKFGNISPVHACTAIDTEFMELIDFPQTFDRYETKGGGWFRNNTPTKGTSTGTATHNIAHMLMGVSDVNSDRPSSVGGYDQYISRNKLDPTRAPDYVIEVAHVDGNLTDIAMHGLTCNNADANSTGWVSLDGGDLTPFVTGTDVDGNTKYGGINRVRVRMLENYPGSNSSYQLNLQARVKPDMQAGDANPAPDGSALYVYASRGRGAWPDGQNAPLNESCTNDSVFAAPNSDATNGWCNLPYNRASEGSGDRHIDDASVERSAGT